MHTHWSDSAFGEGWIFWLGFIVLIFCGIGNPRHRAQKSDDATNTSRQVLTTVTLERTFPFLRDGMTVDVDIVTSDLHHVITVPTDAIRRDSANRPYAWVIRDGSVRRADLALGPANDSATALRSGLAPGDVVVVDRTVTLTAGQAVRPLPSPQPTQSG